MTTKDGKSRIWTIRGKAILTTGEGGEGDQGGEGGGAGGEGQDDLSTLFTPEDIEAKKTAIADAKAEEDRRAALTDEQRAAEDQKKADEEAANAGAPEAYEDFTMPEGATLDKELMEEFKPTLKEFDLSQEKAQKVADMGAKLVQKTLDGVFQKFQDTKAEWKNQCEADQEISADYKLGKESAAVRAWNTITKGDEAAKKFVEETGVGDHPEFIRVMLRVSKAMREDDFETHGGGGAGGEKTLEETMYPTMAKKT